MSLAEIRALTNEVSQTPYLDALCEAAQEDDEY